MADSSVSTSRFTPDELEYIGLLEQWIQEIQEDIQSNGILSMRGFGVVDFCLCFGFGPGIEGKDDFIKRRDELFQIIRSYEKLQNNTWQSQQETIRNYTLNSVSRKE
jgi:hypothetical protein